jgi:phosphoenolpyruvate carboxykinase (ATP)
MHCSANVGSRMKIQHTRAMLNAALSGKLDNVEIENEPFFNLQIPKSCEGVPAEVLNPRCTWKDKNAHDEIAKKLAGMFKNNFKEYESGTAKEIIAAGPK